MTVWQHHGYGSSAPILQLTTPHLVPYSHVWPARPPAEHPARRLAAPHALVAARLQGPRRPTARPPAHVTLTPGPGSKPAPAGSRPPRRACRPTHIASGAADAAMAEARLLCCGRTGTPPQRRAAPLLANTQRFAWRLDNEQGHCFSSFFFKIDIVLFIMVS